MPEDPWAIAQIVGRALHGDCLPVWFGDNMFWDAPSAYMLRDSKARQVLLVEHEIPYKVEGSTLYLQPAAAEKVCAL
jgi:hypothetical protein